MTTKQRERLKVYVRTPEELFKNDIHYQIPRFQRRYVWNEDRHWKPLWKDVSSIAEKLSVGEHPGPHFLGAVVLQDVPTEVGEVRAKLVVDGQQRLTTLQLLIDAVDKSSLADGFCPAERMSDLIWNDDRPHGDEEAFKVHPAVIDRPGFHQSLKDEHLYDPDSNIIRAHLYFKDASSKWFEADQNNRHARVQAMQKVLRDLLHIVVIDLTADDNAHVIFESLNARGERLREFELIKNMLMYEAEKVGVATGMSNGQLLWDFDDQWWDTEVGRGRLKQKRIDIFLNQWLIMRTAGMVRSEEVYLGFSGYFDDLSADFGKGDARVVKVAADLRHVGDIYEPLMGEHLSKRFPAVQNLDLFLYRRNVLQNGAVIPVLLWLFSEHVPDEQRTKAIRALESHMIRRMICGQATAGLNRAYIELVGQLSNCDLGSAGDVVVDFLKGKQETRVATWPTDADLRHAMLNNDLYNGLKSRRLQVVLTGIEQGMRTNKSEDMPLPRNLTVERLMPGSWQEHYGTPTNGDEDRRNHAIHTIGNLSLVTGKLNPRLSNASWIWKKEELAKHSMLFLNKDVTIYNPSDEWREKEIAERAERMFDAATKVWPYADDMSGL
ncbi:MAG: DUF262 domain-containing protein [Chloroflexi bacterium]|nr:DUF262 domain-containing protein [Chloroflexota bacterium]